MSDVVRQVAAKSTAKKPAMKGFVADNEELTEENSEFRRVLYTGKNLQLVLMAIQPGDEIVADAVGDVIEFRKQAKGAAA